MKIKNSKFVREKNRTLSAYLFCFLMLDKNLVGWQCRTKIFAEFGKSYDC